MPFEWEGRRRERVRFRGVEVEALVEGRAGGSRLHVHTYPGIDEPFAENLGRAPRGFSLDFVFVGDDYDRELEAFLELLEQRSAARLELWFGPPQWVQVRTWNSEHRGQGQAVVSVEFVEAGRQVNPQRTPARSLVARALDALENAATAAFPDAVSRLAEVEELGNRVLELGEDLIDELEVAVRRIDRNAGEASEAATRLADFADRVASLATDAANLGATLAGTFAAIAAIPGDVSSKFDTFRTLAGWGDTLPAVATVAYFAPEAEENQAALARLIAQLSAAHLAVVATEVPYVSADDAAEARDTIAAILDAAMLAAADAAQDDVYGALRDAKVQATSHLDERAARLPTRAELTLSASVPSIVLAYRLYGDTELAGDLVERNGVIHPLFVPAGEVLEVLSPDA